jgi:hypothetical protein
MWSVDATTHELSAASGFASFSNDNPPFTMTTNP